MPLSPTRDARIDLLRGLAVLAMIVDHVAGASPLRWLTGGNQFYTSAAEGFVLLAGFSAGVVSARAVQRGSLSATARRFLHRSLLLYLLVCAVWLICSLDQPLDYLVTIVSLKQPQSILDVLLLYAMLFVLAPLAAFLLTNGRTWLLVSLSVAVWGAYQLDPQAFELPSFLGRAGQFGFPLAAWQVLFCAAMAAGYHRARISLGLNRFRRQRLLCISGLSSTALLAVYLVSHLVPGLDPEGLLGKLFFKDAVSIGRLVASASIFPLVYAVMRALGPQTKAFATSVLAPFGRHSLLAFVLHLIAMVAIGMTGAGLSLTPLVNAVLQVLTLGFVWVSISLCTHAAALKRPQPSRRRLALVWSISAALIRG